MNRDKVTGGLGRGEEENLEVNPMHPKIIPLATAPRCGAKTRTGKSCRSPAMENGRCRMHGGMSTGAPKGNKNALKHGRFTAKSIATRKAISELIRQSRELANSY